MVWLDLENVVSGGRGKLGPVPRAELRTGNATESAHASHVKNLVGRVSTPLMKATGM